MRIPFPTRAAFLSLLLPLIAGCSTSGEKKISYQVESLYSVRDPAFRQSIGNLLGPSLIDGNGIVTLVNGDEIFGEMLRAIRSATQTITFETFVFHGDRIGGEFAQALAERARAGVRVHVILDAHGGQKAKKEDLALMRDSGVELEIYRPLRPWQIVRYNNRTHRKLLVIDGSLGFTGGVGIADEWRGNARSPEEWRDNHFKIRGPVVAQLQAAFMDNWLKTHEKVLHGPDYFPPLPRAGSYLAQVFLSSPSQGSVEVELMYLLSIASAQKHIRIANAYFVPDDMSLDALRKAAERGVKVEIIVPGKHIDQALVRNASRERWGTLLQAGVAIYEYQPTMFHVKQMIVDDVWSSVGSANFDNRSFKLNDEANLNVLDPTFAKRQIGLFERDKAQSRRVTYEEWLRRPVGKRVSEKFAGLLFFQL